MQSASTDTGHSLIWVLPDLVRSEALAMSVPEWISLSESWQRL